MDSLDNFTSGESSLKEFCNKYVNNTLSYFVKGVIITVFLVESIFYEFGYRRSLVIDNLLLFDKTSLSKY